MNKTLFTLFLLVFSAFFVSAQSEYHSSTIKRTTGNSGTGANIDVTYHRFEWYLNPDGVKNIQGSVTTYFKTTQDNVQIINFDFNKTSFNNTSLIVKYHGNAVTRSFPTSGNVNILNITLPAALPNNRFDSVTIFYSGAPPAVSGQAEGFQQKTLTGTGTSMYYTLSESYEDKDWWPCKADMQDKIDSTDFIITTPSAFRAAANGVLIKETTSGVNKIYNFKHRYPIASYLVAVAVAKYNVFNRGTVNIGGTNMAVDYYITIGRTPTATQLKTLDFVKQELVVFSEKFGDYPFKNEKYGMYEFGWGGGMEHQTFSAMSWGAMSSAGTIAHELMHQWFGDKVTFATWEHLWLAEGFAKYGEALAGELIPTSGINPVSVRNAAKTSANGSLSNYGCIVPKATIANSNTLWSSNYGSSVYDRGAMVVSMLRILVGDDIFFQACRNYLNDPLLAYGSAVTNDLQRHFEALLDGFDLTPFFDSFVRGNGYPSYTGANAIKWWAAGSGHINIGVGNQTKSTGSDVTYYFTPIPIRVQGAGGKDTVIVVYDRNGKVSKAGEGIGPGWGPVAQFYIGFEPVTVSFDPFYMSLATGTVTQQQILALNILDFEVSKNKENNKAVLSIEETNDVQSILLEKSLDGVHFENAGIMKKSSQNQYIFEDVNAFSVMFYRAKITDVSGKIIYSKTVKITGRETANFSILNNPVSGNIKINPLSQVASGSTINIQIFDIAGKKHLEKNQKVNGDLIEIKNKLQSGTYFLKISGNSHVEGSLKFVVR